MKKTLKDTAKEYIAVIQKIEQTSNPYMLQRMEEQRGELHWQFIDLLKEQGIECTDRDHATRIAYKIAKEEES